MLTGCEALSADLHQDSTLTEASNKTIILIDQRKDDPESSTLALSPSVPLGERISDVWQAFRTHYSKEVQHEYFQSLWDEAREHILAGGVTEIMTLGDYPYMYSRRKGPPTLFTVFEPEINADAKKLLNLSRSLENFWNMAKDEEKVIRLLYGGENLIEFASSCKRREPEKFKWLLLFPGEFHFRMHIAVMNSLAFHDMVLQAFATCFNHPDIKKRYKSDKFAMHEEFLMSHG